MGAIRIISRLDIKGPHLVKGIHLEGLRVLGPPQRFAQYYYENGIDELFYMDVVASLYERNSIHELITRTAEHTFVPLCVGGGIRTLDDIYKILRSGADKVSINTAAVKNPLMIKEASQQFGASTITVAIETIKQNNGEYLIFTDNGREHTGINALDWAKKMEDMGAGEIVITSVDREGTGEGYDLDLITQIANSVQIPVVAHGGAGKTEHVVELFKAIPRLSGVALASGFHYHLLENRLIDIEQAEFETKQEGNISFMKAQKKFKIIQPFSISEVKTALKTAGFEVRMSLCK